MEIVKLKKKRKRLERSTYILPSNIAELEAAPPVCPTTYTKMLMLLSGYICLLQGIFKEANGHL
eukprot:5857415-Ditylum_brightwellii.AAC.1